MLVGTMSCHALLAQSVNPVVTTNRGADAQWLSAAKNGFGTSNTLRSKIWFTLTDGVLSEVYYPTVDVPNVQCLQLLVVTPEGKVETEAADTSHSITLSDNANSLSFRQENASKTGDYTVSKHYVTDPGRNSLLVHVVFKSTVSESRRYKLYVYYDPSLNNSGMHDSAWSEDNALLAVDGNKASALISKPAFVETTNGYLGSSDDLSLLRSGKLRATHGRVLEGNVVQVGQVGLANNHLSFTLALGFGRNATEARISAKASLTRGFDVVRKEYEAGWNAYTNKLPTVATKHQRQFKMSAMVLKALEDKTYRGAIIASPSTPWGGGPNANEATTSGYHAVWSRDLYQVATAFLALGDRQTANRALDYVLNIQQKSDGSVPQNTWVDGRRIGGGVQLDQVALPIVLTYQLGRFDKTTWSKHIEPAAEFLIRNGPVTNQDRWEEKSGYSPATIAAEIAGLVCAAHIAAIHHDTNREKRYLQTADEWARRVDEWTATSNGPYGDGNYYLRISEKGNPNKNSSLEINSGGGTYDQRAIVDAGFLELVRLGIKSANDPLITKSLTVVDKFIRVNTPNGQGWYRYNHDAYGEQLNGLPYDARSGIGRLWTLLTGERGEYELAAGEPALARLRIASMAAFANDGLMIPEQVWDREQDKVHMGSGTGSATPLAWSLAQFIRLVMNTKRGSNLETPRIVAERYSKNRKTK